MVPIEKMVRMRVMMMIMIRTKSKKRMMKVPVTFVVTSVEGVQIVQDKKNVK